MAGNLLMALADQERRKNSSTFTFRHELRHDFESLIWVVVYAMMIRHRNTLAATDQAMYQEYKAILDECWAGHSYANLRRSHNDMLIVGCSYTQDTVSSWFPDPHEAAFFRDAMRLAHGQVVFGEPISYEGLRALFKKHIQLAKEWQDSNIASN
jgi:hypothetical protein